MLHSFLIHIPLFARGMNGTNIFYRPKNADIERLAVEHLQEVFGSGNQCSAGARTAMRTC